VSCTWACVCVRTNDSGRAGGGSNASLRKSVSDAVRLSPTASHSALLKTREVTVGPPLRGWPSPAASALLPQKSSSCSPSCSLHPPLPPPSFPHNLTCPCRLQRSSFPHPSVLPLPSSVAFGELRRGGAPPWRPWRRRRLVDLHRSPHPHSVVQDGVPWQPTVPVGPVGGGDPRSVQGRACLARDLRHPRGRRSAPDPRCRGQAQLPVRRQSRRGAGGQESPQGNGCSWRTRSLAARPAAARLRGRCRRLGAHDQRARPSCSSCSRARHGAPSAAPSWTPAAAATPTTAYRWSGCEVAASSSSCMSRSCASRERERRSCTSYAWERKRGRERSLRGLLESE
jgi:hypothetical protein